MAKGGRRGSTPVARVLWANEHCGPKRGAVIAEAGSTCRGDVNRHSDGGCERETWQDQLVGLQGL